MDLSVASDSLDEDVTFETPKELKYAYLYDKWVSTDKIHLNISDIAYGGYRVVTAQGYVFSFLVFLFVFYFYFFPFFCFFFCICFFFFACCFALCVL